MKALYEENLLSSISSDLKANLFEDNSKFHSALMLRKNKRIYGSIFQEGVLKYYYKDLNSTYKLQNFDFYYSRVGGE